MKRGAGLTVTVAAFITTFILLLLGGSVRAEEVTSNWIDSQLSVSRLSSSSTFDSTATHPYCEAGVKYRYVTNPDYTPYNGKDQFLSKEASSSCWRTAGGWTFGNVSGAGVVFMREGLERGFAGSGYQEEFRGSRYVTIGNYSSSLFEHAKRITFIDDPISTISTVNSQQKISFTYENVDRLWKAKDSSGNERVYGYGFSLNDKWMVYQAANGMYRINLDTREATLFSYPRPVSASGTSYYHDIAVSDDGRYAALSFGGNQGTTSSVWIYDINSCKLESPAQYSDTPACKKRDIKELLGLSASQKPLSLYFTPHGDELVYIKQETDISTGEISYGKYTLSVSGGASRMAYIALGDSFSSGEGDLDGVSWYKEGTDRDGELYSWSNTGIDGFPYELEVCHQSKRSYPYILSGDVSLDSGFASVACSGAIIGDLLGWPTLGRPIYLGHGSRLSLLSDNEIGAAQSGSMDVFFPGRAAQIEFISKYRPAVVTVGIGGNDLGFAAKLKSCIVPELTCTESTALRKSSGYEIRYMYSKYINLFRQLRTSSMTSKIYVVGYPQFLSESPGCQQISVWLDDYEKRYIRESISYLNDVIKAAAINSGVIYLDVEDALEGRQLCDSAYSDAVNSVVAGDDQGSFGGGIVKDFIGNESFHPTNIGHQLMADTIKRQLGDQGLRGYEHCPQGCSVQPIPAVPEYFTNGDSQYDATLVTRMVDGVPDLINDGIAFVDFTKTAVVDTSKNLYNSAINSITFKPSTTVNVTFFSDPVNAGTLPVDESGNVSGEISIPGSLRYGLHTLVLSGVSETNEKMMMYKKMYVYKTLEDMDGNGVLDTQQKCGVLVPAVNLDADRDGLDDACDGYIDPDITPPQVVGYLRDTPGETGWFTHDTVIDWSVIDDRDGVALVQPEETVVNIEGAHEYRSPQVCDSAGNCSYGAVVAKLDKTSPAISEPSWTLNPKRTTESSEMSAMVADALSGVDRVEYFVGENDPGRGNGARMRIESGRAVVENSTDYPTGVFKMSIRAMDYAGNWSEVVSGYLVVYDPTSGAKMRGSRIFDIDSTNGSGLPWISSSPVKAMFGMSVRYDSWGRLVTQSDFQLSYSVGSDCRRSVCHRFELNAGDIQWFTLNGSSKAEGVFKGRGTLKLDGVVQNVEFIVHGVDGERLGSGYDDRLSIEIYSVESSQQIMSIIDVPIGRGNIKVSER